MTATPTFGFCSWQLVPEQLGTLLGYLLTRETDFISLNLTVANCVYILEPQWNPMVENQAIARLTRLGQKRNVKVIRYIMKGTVEVVNNPSNINSISLDVSTDYDKGMRSQQATKLGLAKLGWNAQWNSWAESISLTRTKACGRGPRVFRTKMRLQSPRDKLLFKISRL